MWQRINQSSPLASPPSVDSGTAKPLVNEISESFKFMAIELESVKPTEGIPTPAPVITPDKDPNIPYKVAELDEFEVESYLRKIRNFDAIFASDIYLDARYEALLLRTTQHLSRVETHIGHGNFNLMSFDEMLRYGRSFAEIGKFEADELNFREEVFFANPNRYGFSGKKISAEISDFIPRNDVAKIPNTAHFLLRGKSEALYHQIKKDVGDEVVLTSGVRSIVKQMLLFLAKAIEANGNLSRASRSLAPPGHSYHGIGDFDIGKIGLGAKNFTADFSQTAEYKKIARLGYVDIRYPTDNLVGIRFEPWHIKIT